MPNLTQICSHCGKPLQNQPCFACGGNGYTQELVLLKEECDVCKGSGRLWRCEDEFKHIVEDFKNTHKVNQQPVTQNLHKTLPHIPAPLNVKGKQSTPPQIPSPWHPGYPSPWRPMHPENPWNLNNLHSPLNINSPQNANNPRHPFNKNNPFNRNSTKK